MKNNGDDDDDKKKIKNICGRSHEYNSFLIKSIGGWVYEYTECDRKSAKIK